MSEFLVVPPPERIMKLYFYPDGKQEKTPCLSVGLKEITETWNGVKVIPHLAVVFEIDNVEFDIQLNLARAMADRINEFCDFAENKK